MRYTILILFAITVVAFAGCDAQNPVCTDNFCFVGEAFPRSELEAGQEFSELAIDDSVIFATLIGKPTPAETPEIEPEPETTVTLADIVADVETNGTESTYKGQTVTINAPVRSNLAAPDKIGAPSVTLITHSEKVSFFLRDYDGTNDLEHLDNHTTYTFTISITNISESVTRPGGVVVSSDLEQPPTKANIQIERVTMNEIVSDVAGGGKKYLGKTVKIRATVSFALLKSAGLLTLSTNNANVSFSIADVNQPDKLNRYQSNITYDFTLYIYEIKQDEDGEYSINSGIAGD